MAVVVATPRLILSDIEERDRPDFLALLLREGHWRDLPVEEPSVESVDEMLHTQAQAASADPRRDFYLCARLRDTGAFVGEAFLRLWDDTNGDIGWGVVEAVRGQGLATEIGAAMIQLGFERQGLHRIAAYCRVGNEASRRVMVKLGMQSEGTLREHIRARSEWWSSWSYSILENDPRPGLAAACEL